MAHLHFAEAASVASNPSRLANKTGSQDGRDVTGLAGQLSTRQLISCNHESHQLHLRLVQFERQMRLERTAEKAAVENWITLINSALSRELLFGRFSEEPPQPPAPILAALGAVCNAVANRMEVSREGIRAGRPALMRRAESALAQTAN